MSARLKQLSVGRVLLAAAGLGVALGLGSALVDIHRKEEQLRELATARLPGVPSPPAPSLRHPSTSGPRPDPEALEGLPPYPNAVPMPLLSQPAGVDGELKAAWFATDDSPEAVISFYERELKAAGQVVVSHRFGAGSGYAGYLGADGQKLHLIAVLRQGNQTIAFPSSSSPEKLIERRGQATQVLPAPPGARPALSFALGESGARAYYQTVSDTTVAEVMSFYQRALPQVGWRVDGAVDSGKTGHVDATRAHQSASVTVQQKAGREVSISITIMGQA